MFALRAVINYGNSIVLSLFPLVEEALYRVTLYEAASALDVCAMKRVIRLFFCSRCFASSADSSFTVTVVVVVILGVVDYVYLNVLTTFLVCSSIFECYMIIPLRLYHNKFPCVNSDVKVYNIFMFVEYDFHRHYFIIVSVHSQ